MTNSTNTENMSSLRNTTSLKAGGDDDLSVRRVKESDMINRRIVNQSGNDEATKIKPVRPK